LIAAGVAAGLAVNAIGLRMIAPHGAINYGGIGDLWSMRLVAERLARTGPYATLWVAFVGVTLAVVALAAPRRVFQDRALRILAPGSLAAVGRCRRNPRRSPLSRASSNAHAMTEMTTPVADHFIARPAGTPAGRRQTT